MKIIFGIFLILHGLIHLLYTGQSLHRFEIKPGLLWPDRSWLFSRLLGESATRSLATSLLILAALSYITGGLGLFIQQDWWRFATVGAVALSSLIYLIFWDGKFKDLDAQGAVGLLINLAILALVLFIKFPA